MNERFTKIKPQIAEKIYGAEPSLQEIIFYYYSSNGFEVNKAKRLTEKYINKLSKEGLVLDFHQNVC